MIADVAASSVPAAFEQAAGRRFGLIALATDLTTERDFTRLAPNTDMAFHTARVPYTNPGTPENLRALEHELERAGSLILPGEPLAALAFSCTSASALIGEQAVLAAIARGKPDVPVTMPTVAARLACKRLGVRRISLLTPYSRGVSLEVAGFFEAQGLEVLSLRHLDVDDDRKIARISPRTIRDAAAAALHPEAEALFLSCTALRAAAEIPVLEQSLSLPVISSNQAMFWHLLRLGGYEAPIANIGRLGMLAA